jgi:hypothetical protein
VQQWNQVVSYIALCATIVVWTGKLTLESHAEKKLHDKKNSQCNKLPEGLTCSAHTSSS